MSHSHSRPRNPDDDDYSARRSIPPTHAAGQFGPLGSFTGPPPTYAHSFSMPPNPALMTQYYQPDTTSSGYSSGYDSADYLSDTSYVSSSSAASYATAQSASSGHSGTSGYHSARSDHSTPSQRTAYGIAGAYAPTPYPTAYASSSSNPVTPPRACTHRTCPGAVCQSNNYNPANSTRFLAENYAPIPREHESWNQRREREVRNAHWKAHETEGPPRYDWKHYQTPEQREALANHTAWCDDKCDKQAYRRDKQRERWSAEREREERNRAGSSRRR